MHEDGLMLAPAQPMPPMALGGAYTVTVLDALANRRRALDTGLAEMAVRAGALAEVAARLVEALRAGHKVLVAGNGGSAAEAQHFAAELVGRFKRERAPYPVMSLTTDTSILTAVANDYGYADVFARQVSAFGQPGDLFVAFSTSGESENLVRACAAARQRGLCAVAVTGDRHGRLERAADLTLRMPLLETELIQELHMAVTHILCDIAERELMQGAGSAHSDYPGETVSEGRTGVWHS